MAKTVFIMLALASALSTIYIGHGLITAANAPVPTLIPTQIPSPNPTSTPSPTNTPTPTRRPLPTKIPIPTSKLTSAQIYEMTNIYGNKYRVDPNILRHIAICESGFNPLADNGQYAGMYQYSISTWQSYRKAMQLNPDPILRFDPEEAIKTTAYILSLYPNTQNNWPNCHPK